MYIAVKCVNCDWVGIGELRGLRRLPSLSNQCCPNCNSELKPRAGCYDPGDDLAEYRE